MGPAHWTAICLKWNSRPHGGARLGAHASADRAVCKLCLTACVEEEAESGQVSVLDNNNKLSQLSMKPSFHPRDVKTLR